MAKRNKDGKRTDNKGRLLEKGEIYEESTKRYIFRKMVNGGRVTVTASTLKELRAKKTEILLKVSRGEKIRNDKEKLTLNEYFDYWFEFCAKHGRKATTCTNYKSYYKGHVEDTIGKMRINKIKKSDCQLLIDELEINDKSRSTMLNLKSCLNAIFESAIDDEIIFRNPAKNIQIPQANAKEKHAIEREEIVAFLKFVKEDKKYSRLYPLFLLWFNSGMRFGEIAAITWDDVDFTDDTITIGKTVNRYRKKDYGFTVAVASPKSKTSIRTIPINHDVRKELLKLKMQSPFSSTELPQVNDRGRVIGNISGFVFTNDNGTVWIEPVMRRVIIKIIERQNKEAEESGGIKVRCFCPHEIRHTFASLGYTAGADPKIISEILGHTSTATTLNVYAHLMGEEREKQRELVKALIKVS